MPYRLSLEAEPIVLIEMTGQLTDAELLAMVRESTFRMKDHLRGGKRTATVIDFTKAKALSPEQRKMIGDWRVEVKDLTERVSLGMAMAVQSALIRGVLTALSWFHREPVDVVYVDSVEKGVRWAVERCDAAGVFVPPHARRMGEPPVRAAIKV